MMSSTLVRCGVLATALGCAILAGCDKTVSVKEKSTEGPNGSTVEKEKVVQHPDGSITQEKETSTTKN